MTVTLTLTVTVTLTLTLTQGTLQPRRQLYGGVCGGREDYDTRRLCIGLGRLEAISKDAAQRRHRLPHVSK